jgi:hypothetical protein
MKLGFDVSSCKTKVKQGELAQKKEENNAHTPKH